MYNQLSQYSHDDTQKGFTLVELMISLLLGSLIAAAAFQVFYISQRTSTTQRSASTVQDSAVFGLNTFERHLKLANYGADSFLNDQTVNGGIVLTGGGGTDDKTNAPSLTDNKTYTTQGIADTSVFNSAKSDQLTIQFEVPHGGITDCQGTFLTAGTLLIQRYYLYKGDLYCDSNRSPKTSPSFGNADDGTSIITDVDQFRVLLITEQGIRTPNDYNAITGVKPGIYGVKLGFVFSGGTPTIQAQTTEGINLLGDTLTLKDTASNTIRRVYEPTILFRNARVL